MTHEKLYCCRACRYVFPANAFPARCPDCGKETWYGSPAVRKATSEEMADYIRIRKEITAESHSPSINSTRDKINR